MRQILPCLKKKVGDNYTYFFFFSSNLEHLMLRCNNPPCIGSHRVFSAGACENASILGSPLAAGGCCSAPKVKATLALGRLIFRSPSSGSLCTESKNMIAMIKESTFQKKRGGIIDLFFYCSSGVRSARISFIHHGGFNFVANFGNHGYRFEKNWKKKPHFFLFKVVFSELINRECVYSTLTSVIINETCASIRSFYLSFHSSVPAFP